MSEKIELTPFDPPPIDPDLQRVISALEKSLFNTPPEYIICALCGGDFEPIENGIRCKECKNEIKVKK